MTTTPKHLAAVFTLIMAATTLCASESDVSEGLKALFPDGVLNNKGEAAAMSVLAGKPVVGVYFSAHWCGPCRRFTPELVKYHEQNKDAFEVVFVSSDRSEEAHLSYMTGSDMPWYTLKYKSDAADALKKKYEVRGIPSLVLLNRDGETITKNGRQLIGEGVAAAKIATAKVTEEEYNCGKCSKIHKRSKLVYPDEAEPEEPKTGEAPEANTAE